MTCVKSEDEDTNRAGLELGEKKEEEEEEAAIIRPMGKGLRDP